MLKKVSCLFVFIFFAKSSLFAQIKWSAGISGGAVYSSAQSKESGNVYSYKNRVGLTIGGFADVQTPVNNLYLQPGIFYTQKGGVISDPDINLNTDVLFRYLEIPVWLLFREKTGAARFFGGVGPIIGLGMSGREKVDEQTSQELTFGSDVNTNDYKSFDFSGGLMVGLQFEDAATLSFFYSRTLNNLSLDENITFRNQYIGVRLGVYVFKKKK